MCRLCVKCTCFVVSIVAMEMMCSNWNVSAATVFAVHKHAYSRTVGTVSKNR